nr:MAG TPA: hypothetical protein [Caudoviricetes sp.]
MLNKSYKVRRCASYNAHETRGYFLYPLRRLLDIR